MTPRVVHRIVDAGRRVARMRLSAARRDRLRSIRRGPGAGLRIGTTDASAPYEHGANELPVQEAVVQRLRPGGTFYDVGANVGFFSMLAAAHVGPSGAVVAFEAVDHIARRIEDHARANGFSHVRVLPVAVGARSGRATLHVTTHPGGATLAADSGATDVVGEREVDVVTLDDAMRDGALPVPDLVKIDVEGFEDEVLDGAAGLLQGRRPALVIELDAPEPAGLERKVATMTARLRAGGYDVRRLADSYPGGDWHVAHLVGDPL